MAFEGVHTMLTTSKRFFTKTYRMSDFAFPTSSDSLTLFERSIPRPFGRVGGEATPSVRATFGGDRDCDGAAFVEWEPTGDELLASL
jgi:hypothetical protein